MSADWSNEEAILRDLAIAQGNVPLEIIDTVSSNEKPPSIHIVEETEEHFLRQYAADGNVNEIPDLDLIQEMLDQVRNVRVNEIDASEPIKDDETKTTEITEAEDNTRLSPKKSAKVEYVNKNKQNRNAAIESLLNSNKKTCTADAVLCNEVKGKKKDVSIPFAISPESMFKPKSKNKCENSVSPNNLENGTREYHKPGVYVPSSQAQEYYNKLMENKRQKELREENIWTRAERQMKEIEAKRKQASST